MAKVSGNTPKPAKKSRPAIDPENRMQQMVSKALDLAEKQLEEGTASSQVITHFLKYGTEKSKLEAEKIRYENELLQAKKVAIESQKSSEELFAKAIKAFATYSGQGGDEDDYEYDY